MLKTPIIKETQQIISGHFGKDVVINGTAGVGGGCINDAHRVDTSVGRFFVKYNNATRYPGMFDAEARGLQLLAASETIPVPAVMGTGEADGHSLLVLAFIDSARPAPDFWQNFGARLAAMHKTDKATDLAIGHPGLPGTSETGIGGQATTGAAADKNGKATAPGTKTGPQAGRDGAGDEKSLKNTSTAAVFGLDHDNYIGSLPQSNRMHNNWIDFFVSERLEAQLKLAVDNNRADKGLLSMFNKLYRFLPDFFPDEPPALLHGDLWSGNQMCGSEGQAVILDPAVYFGHRYMDLGMSKLFGGFSSAFYDAYNDTYPLDPAWEDSMDIANLYPLLVHVNLFGGGYLGSVKSIVKSII